MEFSIPIDAKAVLKNAHRSAYVVDDNPRGSFADEVRSYGFTKMPVVPVLGKIERIVAPDDKKGKKSGWYIYNEIPDGYQPGAFIGIGVFGSWKGNPDRIVWTSKRKESMSPAEAARLEEQLRTEKLARDQALQERRKAAAETAQAIWSAATEAPPEHPYLTAKGVQPHGVRVSRGEIVVPVQENGELVSLQFIDPKGGKKFLTGGKTGGCSFRIEGNDETVYVAEGFATGATLAEATGATVYVAYNAGNLASVHAYAKNQHLDAVIIVAGDDDQWTKGNPGRTKAGAIKGAYVVFPIFEDISNEPTDFNDLHRQEGIEAVQKQMAVSIEVAKPPTFDECQEAAIGLSKESSPDDINEVLSIIWRLKPKAIELRKLMEAVKNATGVPLGDLKDGLKEKQREGQNGGIDDLANGLVKEMLAARFNGGFHLIRGNDQGFWQFCGTHWETVTDEFIKSILLEAIEEDKDCVPGKVSYSSMLQGAFSLLIARQAAYACKLRLHDDPPPVINCNNGELWIGDDGSVQLMPHRYDSYLTNVLDIDYIPAETCPKFDQALLDIFQDSTNPAEMSRHYLEFVGYAIQPQRPIPAWFMHYGKGRNGKTKLMETMEKLMTGSAIHSGRIGDFENSRFAIGSLPGKLVLLDDDVDTGTKLPDGFLKSISERKLLTGERKYKDHFEFVATCLPVLLANNLPFTADLSLGIRRRAHIIPFKHVFTDVDADNQLFPYIWKHELSGVLNRAIEGLHRLRKRGEFDQPQDCIDAQQVWLNLANPLTAFIDECCRVERSAFVPIKKLYVALQGWAEECGIRKIPTRNTMKANLEGLGYTIQRRETGNAVYGIKLIELHLREC